ncbi:MAG: DUF1631 domain-containing protein, partial [Oceanicoccus sp.]|uniref:DUF1631 family protein n=1 Tax=Oceanicoccus sp. TaxID=2691044 RepID=UPI002630A14E
ASEQETRETEKTLDQVLEERERGAVSLEALDAELDQQLADFDTKTASTAVEQPHAPVAKDDKLVRQVVEKLVVNGVSDTSAEEAVEITADDPCLVVVDNMTMGSWVELHQDDDKKFRCRLAAIIRSTGKYIFVNRSGMKVAEYNRMSFARAIKGGHISTLDEGLLFDRALESVIGNLRDMKVTS